MISAELDLILGTHAPFSIRTTNRHNAAEDEENLGFHSHIRLFNYRCTRAAFLGTEKRPPFPFAPGDEDTEGWT
ncbi:MAG TPA: hypothetical protein VFY39_11285 [Gammaproteobacteria bacterium]|nr:hypothetical protein [Gammaproteobacteria bacterium]